MTESIETTEAEALDCAEIDERLELVLRAAGSSLRHYTMAKTLADLRAAMRTAMAPLPQPPKGQP